MTHVLVFESIDGICGGVFGMIHDLRGKLTTVCSFPMLVGADTSDPGMVAPPLEVGWEPRQCVGICLPHICSFGLPSSHEPISQPVASLEGVLCPDQVRGLSRTYAEMMEPFQDAAG